MKKITGIIIIVSLILASVSPAYATPKYSEETILLGKEVGLLMEDLEWEEIDRRQQEYRRRKDSASSNDGLHIYSNEYVNQSRIYGAKYSYDEFHIAPVDIPANDGYKSGGFDELHINENYRQNVWDPEHRGNRIAGFDEFRYPDEM